MDVRQFDQLQGADRTLADLSEKARRGQLRSLTLIWDEKSDTRPKVQMYNVGSVEDLKTQSLGLMAAEGLLRSKIGVRGWEK